MVMVAVAVVVVVTMYLFFDGPDGGLWDILLRFPCGGELSHRIAILLLPLSAVGLKLKWGLINVFI